MQNTLGYKNILGLRGYWTNILRGLFLAGQESGIKTWLFLAISFALPCVCTSCHSCSRLAIVGHSAGAICTFQIEAGTWDRFLLSVDAPEDVCPMRGMFLKSSWFRTWRQEQDTLRCFIRVGGESSRFFKSEVTLAR